jgi:hypothetical protein
MNMATKKKTPSSGSTILSVTRARHYAVKFRNMDGKESMALVLVFGKDVRDGRDGVWIVALEDRLNEQLRGNDTIREGVLSFLAKSAKVGADEVPDELEDDPLDLTDLGGIEI